MTTTPQDGGPTRSWKTEEPDHVRTPPPRGLEPDAPRGRRGISGRLFVLGSLAAIAGVWLILVGVLRPSLVESKRRAEFARREVAPPILELLKIHPAGVDERAWDETVRDAYTLVATTAESGSLTIEDETALRDQIRGEVAKAREQPDTVVAVLSALWDHVADIARAHPRPGVPDVDRRLPKPAVLAKTGPAS
ncbi:hypothetical protein [Paludisphaera rhizosphaerae]|nr:hypothetical protein [Paludisphaera rhizosphaerae]